MWPPDNLRPNTVVEPPTLVFSEKFASLPPERQQAVLEILVWIEAIKQDWFPIRPKEEVNQLLPNARESLANLLFFLEPFKDTSSWARALRAAEDQIHLNPELLVRTIYQSVSGEVFISAERVARELFPYLPAVSFGTAKRAGEVAGLAACWPAIEGFNPEANPFVPLLELYEIGVTGARFMPVTFKIMDSPSSLAYPAEEMLRLHFPTAETCPQDDQVYTYLRCLVLGPEGRGDQEAYFFHPPRIEDCPHQRSPNMLPIY